MVLLSMTVYVPQGREHRGNNIGSSSATKGHILRRRLANFRIKSLTGINHRRTSGTLQVVSETRHVRPTSTSHILRNAVEMSIPQDPGTR